MRIFRRTLSILMTVVLTLSLLPAFTLPAKAAGSEKAALLPHLQTVQGSFLIEIWNVGSGLIVGTNGMLRPAENISRAEAAVLVLRFLREAGLVDNRAPAS